MANLIECRPDVMLGKPVVKGTRITVQLILEALAAGEPMEQVLESYPGLTREGLLAALAYAAATVSAPPPGQLAPAT
jgi:uncharacterized protein (DUF433 family)